MLYIPGVLNPNASLTGGKTWLSIEYTFWLLLKGTERPTSTNAENFLTS
jgi:hypothetical protein